MPVSQVPHAPALALGNAINDGDVDPVTLAEESLENIRREDPEGRVFVRLLPERTLGEALAARDRARAGLRRGPLDGVPVAWKDNVNTGGAVTAAGSRLLDDNIPARDATVLARATLAGTVFLGKTNLTEIAFSGLGINPITGTPANAFDPHTPRVPGGSSSGTAIALARQLCTLGIGTDTGGSVRVPSAWNGLVGLKTTTGLLPTEGIIPLAASVDTVGPMTRSVADAAALHAVLAGQKTPDLAGGTLKGVPLLALPPETLGHNEPEVLIAFERSLEALAQAGAALTRKPVAALEAFRALVRKHNVPGVPEATAAWRAAAENKPGVMYAFIEARLAEADPGSAVGWAGYLQDVADLRAQVVAELAGHAALVLPTVALRPPPIASLETDSDAYARANRRALSNTAPINSLGLCAITLPAGQTPADADTPALPFGLQFVAKPFGEAALLRLAAAAEPVLAGLAEPAAPVARDPTRP